MSIVTRALSAMGLQTRAAPAPDPSWAALAPSVGYTATINAQFSENLASVLACTTAIGTALASIPALIYRIEGDRRVEALDHPLRRIVRGGVSDSMGWPDFVEHLVASTLLTGNGLAEIVRGRGGELRGFAWVPWGMVTVQYLASGRLAYDVADGRGNTRRLLQSEVIHLRDRTDDGLIGRSRLTRAGEAVDAVKASHDYARNFTKRGMAPGGIITSLNRLSQEQKDFLRGQITERIEGTANAGKTLLLDDGMTYSRAGITPEDAELLATRKFGTEEICRLFQVPPPLVQDYSNNTFTNSETAGRWFAIFCLGPWARKIEAEFARSVFPDGGPYELELDLSGFLRGDPETRWNAHKIALDAKVLDPDEVRQVEGWNPRGTPAPADPAGE